MTKPFIPRSQRLQVLQRKTRDSEQANLQNINKVNQEFWENKKSEDDERQRTIDKHRNPYKRL